MKNYIHARLSGQDLSVLKTLKETTGASESELVRQGLQMMYNQKIAGQASALDLADDSVGKFTAKRKDLSSNKQHLKDFGK